MNDKDMLEYLEETSPQRLLEDHADNMYNDEDLTSYDN